MWVIKKQLKFVLSSNIFRNNLSFGQMYSMASGEIKCQHLFELKNLFLCFAMSRLNHDLLGQFVSQPEN